MKATDIGWHGEEEDVVRSKKKWKREVERNKKKKKSTHIHKSTTTTIHLSSERIERRKERSNEKDVIHLPNMHVFCVFFFFFFSH